MTEENNGADSVPPTEPVKNGYYFENGVYTRYISGTAIPMMSVSEELNNLATLVEHYKTRAANGWAEITDYQDFRLEKFWNDAHEVAQDRGYCDIYDQIVDALGGIPRQRDFTVTVPVSGYLTTTVMARNAEDAEEIARGILDDIDLGELENPDLDWYNAEINKD